MYLIDTCAFIWELHNDPNMSVKAAEVMERDEAELYISIVTFWEIAIKKTLGKLEVQESVTELGKACIDHNITIIPIKMEYLERIQKLPYIHKDPFDRLIIATAIEEGLTILTGDEYIKQYNEVKQLW